MSPLLRDALRVGLCPDRLLFARYAKGLHPRLRNTETLRLASDATAPPWRGALLALGEALPERARGANVSFVLSNHFVRYALLPWSRELRSEAEWSRLARHAFVSTHGTTANGWDIRVSAHRAASSRVASAVDAELIEGLQEACATAGIASASVQPYLMVAFNQARNALQRGPAWFTLFEPGRLAIAYIAEGAWRHLRMRRTTDPRTAIAEAVRCEAALAGIEDCERAVFVGDVEPDGTSGAVPRIEDCTPQPGAATGQRGLTMVLA